MSAIVKFTCNAHSSPNPEALCNNAITMPLFNDGQYTNFNTPDGWHIVLGFNIDGSDTLVRCPSHCKWHPASWLNDEQRHSYWEDAP